MNPGCSADAPLASNHPSPCTGHDNLSWYTVLREIFECANPRCMKKILKFYRFNNADRDYVYDDVVPLLQAFGRPSRPKWTSACIHQPFGEMLVRGRGQVHMKIQEKILKAYTVVIYTKISPTKISSYTASSLSSQLSQLLTTASCAHVGVYKYSLPTTSNLCYCLGSRIVITAQPLALLVYHIQAELEAGR